MNTALDTRVDRESQWSRKGSIAVCSEHKFLQVMNNSEKTQVNPSTILTLDAAQSRKKKTVLHGNSVISGIIL